MGIWAKELQKKMTAENETEKKRIKNQESRRRMHECMSAWMHE
jgi:hypothetical protein